MSDEKGKVSDKASEIAKNIWLAGVGAYGKAVEDAQGRIEKAMEPPKLFRDLVKAGAALEEDAKAAIETTTAARQSVEDRIGRVRDNFQMQRPARVEELEELRKEVAKLTRKVERLTRALADSGVKAKPKKKVATKKKAAPKAKTTPKKKTAAKKPAAKKKPASKAPPTRRKTKSTKR
ncbi:MAG: phasin family protein [Halioglobus sp.]